MKDSISYLQGDATGDALADCQRHGHGARQDASFHQEPLLGAQAIKKLNQGKFSREYIKFPVRNQAATTTKHLGFS